jgi:NADPH-dependent curcumin reductase CurA
VLSLLGLTAGPTAYFGLLDVGQPRAGETLVVDAAAGAVGALVGQIGKIKGCRVVGIAGGPEKCAYVTDTLGFDACIDYKSADVGKGLDEHCPDGIDVCFENVGGPIFDEILLRMNLGGRVSLCGLIAGYNEAGKPVPGPYSFGMILMRRLRVQGFIVLDFIDALWARPPPTSCSGRPRVSSRPSRTCAKGFDTLPEALRQLLRGEKHGKLVVEP